MAFSIEQVTACRADLWAAGFRPVPVLNPDTNVASPGKQPAGREWQIAARKSPPFCVLNPAVAHALNSGILCDGLRAVDIDIDDAILAGKCRDLLAERLGDAPVRFRQGSPRCLLLYRAAVGEPGKITLAGKLGKIEVLGTGQQFVAFGLHPSGAELQWAPIAPGEETRDHLTPVTEDAIAAVLAECAPIIEAQPPSKANGHDRDHAPGEAQADPLRVMAALAAIGNDGPPDWEWWNRIGMATWAATGGSRGGFEAWSAWSARSPAYDKAATTARWNHYSTSPPTQIGAGTIFHLARSARQEQQPEIPQLPPPHDLGEGYWHSVMSEAEEAVRAAGSAKERAAAFNASPINWDEMLAVPPREWVYGHFLIKRFVSVLGAPGGTGKTAYTFAVALAIIAGQEFLGEKVHEPGNVWIYNLEDPKDELLRRFRAVAQRWGIGRAHVEGRLFLDSGRDRPLVIAQASRDGGVVVSPIVQDIIDEIRLRQVRVMIVDPFVRSHRLEENVNEQIDLAVALWGQVADRANCAILLVHHFRKGGISGQADAFRGASALIDAARAALSLAPMSEDDANRVGVPLDDRWRFIRVDNAKLNLAPPPEATFWLKLIGEDIGNATAARPSDRVQTVERWEPPSAWDGLPWSAVIRTLEAIDAGPGGGEFFTSRRQAADRWAGSVLVTLGKTAEQAAVIIRGWVSSGVLEEGLYHSPSRRREVQCVRLNQAKIQEMRREDEPRSGLDE